MPDETPAKPPRTKRAAAKPAAAKPKPAAQPAPAAALPSDETRTAGGGWLKVGVGVGSAALVAALLYATRSKPKDWSK